MRLSHKRIEELQHLLKEHCDLDYSEEEAQQAGVAIVRFIVAKERRKQELDSQRRYGNGKLSSEKQVTKS